MFSGESMFHRECGASKVAVVELCSRLVEAGVVLIDTERESENMEQLGQVAVTREKYLAAVHHLRDARVELPTGRRPASRLVHPVTVAFAGTTNYARRPLRAPLGRSSDR